MKGRNFPEQVSDHETSKSTDDGKAGKVKGKEIRLCHFFSTVSTAASIESTTMSAIAFLAR
jgi:hypothetical protein